MNKVLPVFRPAMGQAEIDAVAEVIRSGWIGLGPKTEEFENKFAKYVNSGYAIGLNSATAALHLAMLALGIGKGDEVLVPSMTFVSTAHAVLYVGAKPVFVDVDEVTLCMDPDDLEKKITKRSKAVIPVHFGGHPVDLDRIKEITQEHKLTVVEDASHACGSQYKGKMIGGLSDLTCFSFHAVKNLASVTPDTPVFIKRNGISQLINIGELDKKIIGEKCLSFTKSGKIIWATITNFIKHKKKEKVLEVILEKGRKVKITQDHSVFKYDGANFMPVFGKDLKEGDYLAVPRKLIIDDNLSSIDLLDYLKDKKLVIHNNKIRLVGDTRGGNAGNEINRFLQVNEKLAKLLGYYVAEGYIDGYSRNGKGKAEAVMFTFSAKEKNTYVKEVIGLIRDIFGYKAKGYIRKIKGKDSSIQIIVCSSLLANIIEAIDCGKGACKKKIPNIIWSANEKCKERFIEGLFNGDGHRRSQDGYTLYEHLGVASSKLANDVHYLLLSLGIQSSLYQEENSKYQKFSVYMINKKGQNQSKENTIPKCFVDNYNQKESFSIKKIRKNNLVCNSNLLKDIALLEIKKLNFIDYDGFVYDFSVKGYENFIGGYGAICLHNTGDGGMVTTNNKKLADAIKRLRWVGINKETWEREELVSQKGYRQYGWYYEVTDLGYKYHMNDLTAAIGLVQLSKLSRANHKRNQLAKRYDKKLSRLKWLKTPVVLPWAETSRHNYVIRTKYRDRLNLFLNKQQISTGVHYFPVHLQPYYINNGFTADVPITEKVWKNLLTLPLYPTLSLSDQDRVINAISEFGKAIDEKTAG